MNQKSSVTIISILLVVLVLSLPACGGFSTGEPALSAEERAQTIVAETLAVEHYVQTVVAATLAVSSPPEVEQAEPVPEVIEVPEPTATEAIATPIVPTATEAYTPTPGVPMVSVSVDTNCRTGPGQLYDMIGALMVGEQAEVVGAAVGGGYWIIKNPDRAGECWLWANYATAVGETASLPMYTPPPTPTPVYNWTGTWTTSHGPPALMHETIILTLTQTNATVTGSFTLGTEALTLSGTLSADYMTLTGTWTQTTPPSSGPFVFKLISADQFIGNRENGAYEWCGYRGGASLPSPCMGP